MIDIYTARIGEQLPPSVYGRYLHRLPLSLQQRNGRYKRWQDRHTHLLGKLLLLDGLKRYGYPDDCLEQLQYNPFGRPFLPGAPDFNISHSGGLVVCALTPGGRLGIDCEKVRPLDFTTVRDVMSAAQWEEIYRAADPLRAFFRLWVIKESVAKAEEKGLNLCLPAIRVSGDRAFYEDSVWELKEVEVGDGYLCYLAYGPA
ncbi:4'-phosphopantetheinyl transferase superfamily protein [Paraflavisolibacter sp. H34]|uniref:4'-phosphopantetheinyl transferase family protein n=1 Tax=Huijunlia imazamoxiresistens TaxID=3127457 RepID=UPI00301967B5